VTKFFKNLEFQIFALLIHPWYPKKLNSTEMPMQIGVHLYNHSSTTPYKWCCRRMVVEMNTYFFKYTKLEEKNVSHKLVPSNPPLFIIISIWTLFKWLSVTTYFISPHTMKILEKSNTMTMEDNWTFISHTTFTNSKNKNKDLASWSPFLMP